MDPVLFRLVVVVAILAVVLLVGRWWRRADGAVREVDGVRLGPGHLDALGLDLGDADAGAVLLGSPACAPCESVKQVLHELSTERRGFRWVYADAADHLELTEEHRVLRVPTLLVLEGDGRIRARTSGVPRSDDLRRVLDGSPA